MTIDAPNTPNKAEKKRGYEEGIKKLELLSAKWPKAFPAKSYQVRPLTNGAQQAIVEEFGWSPDYARAVLTVWKQRDAYCLAILRYPTRINLDGSPSDEGIDEASRATATARLEQRAAREAKKRAGAEQQRLRMAAKASAQPKAPAPEPAPTAITETKPEPAAPPEPEPPKPGKLLVAGSAAMQAALKRRLASGSITTEVLKTVPAATPSAKREQRAR
jgi:sRNA-binding protein